MSTYDIALIGGSGFVAGHLLDFFKLKRLSCLVMGRIRPANILGQDFVPLDLATQTLKDVFLERSDIRFNTLIFNSAIKNEFEPDTPEWRTQGLVTAPSLVGLPPFQRLITIGSSAEYGRYPDATEIPENATPRPGSSYGYWKLKLFENSFTWAGQTGTQFIHLRPFNIIGPGADPKMFVGSLIRSLLENKAFKMTAGDQYRSFLSVDTLVKTVEALLSSPSWETYGPILNVSEPHYMKIKDMVQLIQNKIRSGNILAGEIPYRTDEVWHQNPNLRKLKSLLGENYFQPLELTVDEMIESIRLCEKLT
jgi:nucleoside-diphosphate-sugar epimerase